MSNIGDLKVYEVTNKGTKDYKVETPLEGKKLIFELSMVALSNDNIDFNMFGLLEFTGDFENFEDGWCEWYDANGYDISEVYEQEEKAWSKQ